MQEKLKYQDINLENKNEDLLQQFEAIKEKPITRVVLLKYNSCCGCGCRTTNIKREVPYDSPLQDGDTVNKLEKGDI